MERKKRDKHHLEHKIVSNYNKSSAYSIMLAFLCLAGTIQSLFVFIPFLSVLTTAENDLSMIYSMMISFH